MQHFPGKPCPLKNSFYRVIGYPWESTLTGLRRLQERCSTSWLKMYCQFYFRPKLLDELSKMNVELKRELTEESGKSRCLLLISDM